MGRTVLQLAMYLGALLPLAQVVAASYLWRGSLGRPWLFAVFGAIGLYLLMAVTLAYAFSGIGISGVAPAGPQPLFDPLAVRYFVFMLGFVAAGAALLWGLRRLLAGPQRDKSTA